MASLNLSPDRRSPKKARDFVTGFLTEKGVDRQTVDDAALLTTELVTNSVIHARTAMRLDVDVDDAGVHVAVSDAATSRPELRVQDHDSTTGRGLYVLDRVASDWGVDYGEGTKTVRFTLALGQVGHSR